MRIVLIAGGWSSERDVSLNGARQIHDGLVRLGHEVTLFDPEHDLRGLRAQVQDQDFAFINLHGSPGEDGVVQALLEFLRIPFQGAGARASMLALNKAITKQLYVEAQLPTPRWEFIPARNLATWEPRLPFPLVIKPNTGGSSIGVSLVHNGEELRTLLNSPELAGVDVLAEALVRGQELTCGVLDGTPLPPILIRPKCGTFFDYTCKYTSGASEELCPAPVNEALTCKLQELAQAAHDALDLTDYSRTDFILSDNGELFLLETNTLPGMTSTSLLPQEAEAAGLPFDALLARLIELGLRKKWCD